MIQGCLLFSASIEDISNEVVLPQTSRSRVIRHKRVGITVSSDYGWPSNLKLAFDHLAGNKQFRQEPWTTAGRWPAVKHRARRRHAGGFVEARAELFRSIAPPRIKRALLNYRATHQHDSRHIHLYFDSVFTYDVSTDRSACYTVCPGAIICIFACARKRAKRNSCF